MDFESHITLRCTAEKMDHLQAVVASIPPWSFSRIADDPVLGVGVFCYATAHFGDIQDALVNTKGLSEALRRSGYEPVRRKIEMTVIDERCINEEWKQTT